MKKSIKKNYIYNLIYQILSIIIPIITAPYLARVLGAEGTGVSSYTLSIVSYFILFGSVGVASYGQREIAMNRDNKYKYSKIFWELFIFKTITSLLSLLAYTFVIISAPHYNIIYLILGINILSSIFDISWFYQGLEDYKFISLINIIIKVLCTLSIFIFIKQRSDLNLYVLISSLSLIMSTILLWIKIPKELVKVKRKDLKIFSHTKNTFIYFLPQIATQIYTMLDKTMLGLITNSETQNGYYEQAHKIILMALTIVTSLNTVMSPRMSYLYKENKIDEIKRKLLKSLQFSSLLAIPMAFGIACTAYGMVDWFFGPGYDDVKLLMVIFSPIVFIISLSNCLGNQCLTPCGKRLQSAGALWVGAIVNFLLNLILIKNYKSMGAAIASVVAELVITVLYFIQSKEYIRFTQVIKKTYKYLIASIFMSIGVLVLYNSLSMNVGSTLIEMGVGISIYSLVLLILKDDLFKELYMSILNKFRRSTHE